MSQIRIKSTKLARSFIWLFWGTYGLSRICITSVHNKFPLLCAQRLNLYFLAPHLTKITRDQSFITWLAAINERTNKVIVLRAVRWQFKLNIDVNPKAELGERAKLVGRIKQEKPRIQNGTNCIPVSWIRLNFAVDCDFNPWAFSRTNHWFQ